MQAHLILILGGLAMASPALAQDWGSGYNMGSIGVSGGSAATGEIMIDCAEAGNGVVSRGAFSLFLKPAEGASTSEGEFTFDVDGTSVVLPFGADKGDGFVYEKSPETLDAANQLIGLLRTGETLAVSAAATEIANISLDGAAAALEGVEVCLVP